MFLHRYALDVIEGRKPGKSIFYLLSLFYRQAVALRHWAYDKGLLTVSHVSVPVVSVGNIVSGGTGKTPLIRLLAEELSGEKKVAILSRGYRSSLEKGNRVMQIAAKTPVDLCGDEPFWLASKLPQVQVWVGKERKEAARQAMAAGAEILLLDDGMQHRQLHRDIQIVTMSAQDLWGKGEFLPRGYLRDLPERLATADLLVITHTQDHTDREHIRRQLRVYTPAPVCFVQTQLEGNFSGKKVGVFCGIAHPERFLLDLEKRGAHIVSTSLSLDHTLPSLEELEAFAKRSRDQKAELLLCTEKDAVKLPQETHLALPVAAVQASLEFVEGKSHWDNLLERIKYERRNQNYAT